MSKLKRMKFKTWLSVATVSAVALGTSSATMVLSSSQPACAQTLQECVQNLIQVGVSPDVAATTCQAQANSPAACVENMRYTTVRTTAGQTDSGTWRFPQTYGPPDGSAMRGAGCSSAGFLGVDGWRCPNQEMRFEVMTVQQAQAACTNSPNTGNSGVNRPPQAGTAIRNNNPQTLTTNTGNIVTLLSSSGTVFSNGSDSRIFSGSAGQYVRIVVTGQQGFDPQVTLTGPQNQVLAENDDRAPGDLNSEIYGVLPANGVYHIAVRGFGGSSGTYTLRVEQFP